MCQRISLAEQLKIQLEVVESPLHAETAKQLALCAPTTIYE